MLDCYFIGVINSVLEDEQHQQQYGYLAVPPARFAHPRPPVRHGHSPLAHTHTHTQSFLAKRPSLQDSPSDTSHPHYWTPPNEIGTTEDVSHSFVQRTHSAPPNPPPDPPAAPADTDPDLNSRLESLCLRMTEQSLEL